MLGLTRREFIGTAEKGRYTIRDVQAMVISGPRTYTVVRLVANNGVAGIAEAYGSPAIGVKEQILSLKPWLVGKDPLNPDLRNSGGFLETKRIADMADVFGLPLCNHNTGSQLHTWATCQRAGAIRDYMTCETVNGQGGWIDQLLALNGRYIEAGFVRINDKPGLGVDLDPDTVKAHLAAGEDWWG